MTIFRCLQYGCQFEGDLLGEVVCYCTSTSISLADVQRLKEKQAYETYIIKVWQVPKQTHNQDCTTNIHTKNQAKNIFCFQVVPSYGNEKFI